MSSETSGRAGMAVRLAAAFHGGPLAVRDFRLLSIGQLASTTGDFCYAVALPWLILSGHGGPVLLGTVLACYGVPRTVLIPVGGILADRLSPRAVMLAADAVRCVLVAVLTFFAARGLVSLAFLGPVAALIGAGEGLFLPASAAIMPSLLPSDKLQAGNGLSAAMIQVGTPGRTGARRDPGHHGRIGSSLRRRRGLIRDLGRRARCDARPPRTSGRSGEPGNRACRYDPSRQRHAHSRSRWNDRSRGRTG